MLVTTGIHLSVPFIKKGIPNLGVSVRFGAYGKGGSEPKKRTNSMLVAHTLDCTQAEDLITSLTFIGKGALQHGVSAFRVMSIVSEKVGKHFVEKFRLPPVAERLVKEREKKGPTLGMIYNNMHTAFEVHMFCRTRNSDVVLLSLSKHETCSQESMGLAQEHMQKSKRLVLKHVIKFFRPPSRTPQEKVVASRSDCAREFESFVWRAAHLFT